MSFWLHVPSFCGKWEGCVPVNQFINTSWMVVVSLTDSPNSVCNPCVIGLSWWRFVLSFIGGMLCWYKGFWHKTASDLVPFLSLLMHINASRNTYCHRTCWHQAYCSYRVSMTASLPGHFFQFAGRTEAFHVWSVHIKYHTFRYTCSLCREHSQPSTREVFTSPGHLVSPFVLIGRFKSICYTL